MSQPSYNGAKPNSSRGRPAMTEDDRPRPGIDHVARERWWTFAPAVAVTLLGFIIARFAYTT